jgi:hypothetical protein
MRAARLVEVATAMALVLGAATGCASTTNGAGAVGRGSATRPTDFPASPGAASSTTAPATDPVVSSAAATAPSSAFPSVAPPKECANTSDCKLVKSYKLGSGVVVGVFSAPSASGGIGAAVLMMARDQTPTYWHVFDGETPSELLCAVADSGRNCALVNFVGAHAATGYPLVVSTLGITIGPSVGSDTPALHLGELDDDNLVDVYGLQNNYNPDYASGHVQWQTWRRSGDAVSFASTGCGPLAAKAPADPTGFLTGTCDSG